jgi:hypothetical protein
MGLHIREAGIVCAKHHAGTDLAVAKLLDAVYSNVSWVSRRLRRMQIYWLSETMVIHSLAAWQPWEGANGDAVSDSLLPKVKKQTSAVGVREVGVVV